MHMSMISNAVRDSFVVALIKSEQYPAVLDRCLSSDRAHGQWDDAAPSIHYRPWPAYNSHKCGDERNQLNW